MFPKQHEHSLSSQTKEKYGLWAPTLNPQSLTSFSTIQRELRDLSPNISVPKRLNGVSLNPLPLPVPVSVTPVNFLPTPYHNPKIMCFVTRAKLSTPRSKVLRLACFLLRTPSHRDWFFSERIALPSATQVPACSGWFVSKEPKSSEGL